VGIHILAFEIVKRKGYSKRTTFFTNLVNALEKNRQFIVLVE